MIPAAQTILYTQIKEWPNTHSYNTTHQNTHRYMYIHTHTHTHTHIHTPISTNPPLTAFICHCLKKTQHTTLSQSMLTLNTFCFTMFRNHILSDSLLMQQCRHYMTSGCHSDRLPKSLLASRVPYLQLDLLTWDFNYSGTKLYSDGVRTIGHNWRGGEGGGKGGGEGEEGGEDIKSFCIRAQLHTRNKRQQSLKNHIWNLHCLIQGNC